MTTQPQLPPRHPIRRPIRGVLVTVALLPGILMASQGLHQYSASKMDQALFPPELGNNPCAIQEYHLGEEFGTKSALHMVLDPFVKTFHQSTYAPNCDSIVTTLYNDLLKTEVDVALYFLSALTGTSPMLEPKLQPTITNNGNAQGSFLSTIVNEVFGPTIDSFQDKWSKVSQSYTTMSEAPKYNNKEELAQAMHGFFLNQIKSHLWWALPAIAILAMVVASCFFRGTPGQQHPSPNQHEQEEDSPTCRAQGDRSGKGCRTQFRPQPPYPAWKQGWKQGRRPNFMKLGVPADYFPQPPPAQTVPQQPPAGMKNMAELVGLAEPTNQEAPSVAESQLTNQAAQPVELEHELPVPPTSESQSDPSSPTTESQSIQQKAPQVESEPELPILPTTEFQSNPAPAPSGSQSNQQSALTPQAEGPLDVPTATTNEPESTEQTAAEVELEPKRPRSSTSESQSNIHQETLGTTEKSPEKSFSKPSTESSLKKSVAGCTLPPVKKNAMASIPCPSSTKDALPNATEPKMNPEKKATPPSASKTKPGPEKKTSSLKQAVMNRKSNKTNSNNPGCASATKTTPAQKSTHNSKHPSNTPKGATTCAVPAKNLAKESQQA